MNRFVLRGPLACFARPESPDRFSYPIPPCSALRGVISAIYDHPGIFADVRRISVLAPIRYVRVGHTHVGEIFGVAAGQPKKSVAEVDKRTTVEGVLVDPAWLVEFLWRPDVMAQRWKKGGPPFDPVKATAIFRRRLDEGEFYYSPSLGLHQFRAIFHAPRGDERPIVQTRDLGMVLHDIDYRFDPPIPHVYHAVMRHGVIDVPSFYDTVLQKEAA